MQRETGVMSKLISEFDWSETPIGPVETPMVELPGAGRQTGDQNNF